MVGQALSPPSSYQDPEFHINGKKRNSPEPLFFYSSGLGIRIRGRYPRPEK
jgi:hypothetical protein